jgi:hypothetical protein
VSSGSAPGEWPPPGLAGLDAPEAFVRAALEAGAPVVIDGCNIYGGKLGHCAHGLGYLYLPPGTSAFGGFIEVRDGGCVEALPGGGAMVWVPCPQCPPAGEWVA